MNIGIDARFYSSASTGIGCYVKELIDHLAKIDDNNHYTIFLNNPFYETFEPHKKMKKVLVDIKHYSFSEQWRFLKILSKHSLDLMHFTHFNAPILYRQPSIVTIHDLTLNFFPGKKMTGLLSRIGYHIILNSIVKRAKRIITVSNNTKKDLIKLYNVPEKTISVIHLGVNDKFHVIKDTNIINKFRSEYSLNKPYILYTGVWRSHKNLVNLIKAFSILKHKYLFDGLLVISGKEDPWYPEVKKTVIDNGLSGQVRFTGHVPDEEMVLLYNSAKVYVLPSLYEGFGLPVLEAFACGVPVCASRTSSIPEVCGNNNALLFDPYSPYDIAEKIASFTQNDKKREEYIGKGIVRSSIFSWNKVAQETLKIYQRYVHPSV